MAGWSGARLEWLGLGWGVGVRQGGGRFGGRWVGGRRGWWVGGLGRRVAVGGGSFPVRGGVLSLFAGGPVPDLGVRVSAEWGFSGGGSRVGVHPRFIVGGGVGVVAVVAAGVLVGVDPGGWGEFGQAVAGDADGPVLVVCGVVVSGAEEDGVVQVGGAAVGPVPQMVGVAPAGGQVAAGEGAARIPQDQGAAQRGGDGALRAAEVQGLAGPAEDGGDDFGVAGESAHGGGGQVLAGVQGAGANFGGEFGVVQGEHQSGFLPALGGQVPAA